MKIVVALLLAVLLLPSCIKSYKYDEGQFPDKPVNMVEFNTEFNDYNSAMPASLIDVFPLLFSSDRGGGNYDIVKEYVSISFDREDGDFNLNNSMSGNLDISNSYVVLGKIPRLINTDSNEMGPYIMESYPEGYNKYDGLFRVLYASDKNGNLDVYYTSNTANQADFSAPVPVTLINTHHNDAYPSFNEDHTTLYFTSDRGGNFDVYSTPVNGDFEAKLTGSAGTEITKEMVLSSDYDDKCPYVNGDFIVFTSNRPGGFGGFDLYYSKKVGNNWTTPVNFGAEINTEKDEYRPVVARFNFYKNNLMIFSSNRDGGKGGFDLYYVGINK
ncbi:MAG TPA: hypothetical protein VK172_03790 [Lentimicrobium sp.]|nr:hypothetical protein [Lentimicrobium sp.]